MANTLISDLWKFSFAHSSLFRRFAKVLRAIRVDFSLKKIYAVYLNKVFLINWSYIRDMQLTRDCFYLRDFFFVERGMQ